MAGLNHPVAGLDPAEVAPFLGRLVRLDSAAIVRLRPDSPAEVRLRPDAAAVALWGRVPWGVLVTRTVPGSIGSDTSVGAGALLRSLTEGDGSLPPARDRDWRWALPPGPGTPVEALPAGEVHRLGVAAAETLAAARGRVGERMLRDTLLEHVPIVVTVGARQIQVRQGLVQAALRMAFINTDGKGEVIVRITGSWVGLGAKYGSVWVQTAPSLAIRSAN
jgi:hypothetical protein